MKCDLLRVSNYKIGDKFEIDSSLWDIEEFKPKRDLVRQTYG